MINVNPTLQFQVSFNDVDMTSHEAAKGVEPSLTFKPFYYRFKGTLMQIWKSSYIFKFI